jgi:ribosomal protein L40E
MTCYKCKAENPAEDKFCGQCGAALNAAPVPVPNMEGAFYCDRHKTEPTLIKCGRCEKPICVRCTVHGPAGPRCRACARHSVPLRPMGVLHEASRGLGSPGVGRTVWYLAIWYFIISIFTGFGGHRD